jgi:cardiolipin synthase (CMP-forming)
VNIPNILTTLRFVLIPIFGYYLLREQFFIAVSLFLIGGITDVLDGYIARKFKLITSFGKLADPLADKLMQITALVILTRQGLIPMVFLVIVLAKELFMAMGSISLYKKENVVVEAYWYGKLATVVFFVVIVLIIILRKFNISHVELLINIATGLAVVLTLFAFFMYSIAYRKIKSESK